MPRLLLALALVSLAGCRDAASDAAPETVVATDAPAFPDSSVPDSSVPADTPGDTTGDLPTLSLPGVVPAERLAEALPAEVGGEARSELVAEQDSAMGLSVSRAEGIYGVGDDAVTLLVLDVGSAEGAKLMGLQPTGEERLDGFPVRRDDTPSGASVQIRVGARYLVEARGPDAGALDAYVRAVNLDGLPGAD